MSLSYSNHRCIGFSSSELAEGLTQIAVNDNNKKMVIRWDYYLVLIDFIAHQKCRQGRKDQLHLLASAMQAMHTKL